MDDVIFDYIEKIDKLMAYLRMDNYDIPSYNIQLPMEADGPRYRPERAFRYHKATRAITYNGWSKDWHSLAGPRKDEIEIHGIGPTLQFAERIYSFLRGECLSQIGKRMQRSVIDNVADLVLTFNNLEFLMEE